MRNELMKGTSHEQLLNCQNYSSGGLLEFERVNSYRISHLLGVSRAHSFLNNSCLLTGPLFIAIIQMQIISQLQFPICP